MFTLCKKLVIRTLNQILRLMVLLMQRSDHDSQRSGNFKNLFGHLALFACSLALAHSGIVLGQPTRKGSRGTTGSVFRHVLPECSFFGFE